MPVNEENKELRDLVAETLKAKGVLGKVQAEIRASVFLALEEQDVFKDKSPFLNQPLKDFVKTPDGLKVLLLVREFLEFFNLEFTSMVFDPETHAGVDYNYEGRSKLSSELALDNPSSDRPLLAHILSPSKKAPVNDASCSDLNGKQTVVKSPGEDQNHSANTTFSLGINGDKTDGEKRNLLSNGDAVKNTKPNEVNSLTSLSNLPPLNNRTPLFSPKGNDLKSLIDIGLNSRYDKTTDATKQSRSGDSESEESEIEEDIASHNSNMSGCTAVSDDNTVDASVSKASGHGDFMQEVVTAPKKNAYNGANDGNMAKAAVSEELKQLKALSLSFVKDLKIGSSRLSPQTSCVVDPTLSSSETSTQFDSKCATISDIEDLDGTDDGDMSLMENSELNDWRSSPSALSVNTTSKLR